MKKLTAVLTGSMFLLLGLFLFSFLPGIVHAQQSGSDLSNDITPTLNCPPGKFDSLMGVCKDTSKEQPAIHKTVTLTPEANCPAGKWDSLMGVCKDTSKEQPATSMAAPITPTDTEPAAE